MDIQQGQDSQVPTLIKPNLNDFMNALRQYTDAVIDLRLWKIEWSRDHGHLKERVVEATVDLQRVVQPLFEEGRLKEQESGGPKTIYQLVGEYSNAVGRFGSDSEQVRQFRAAHADNKELMEYADALDRIKRHLDHAGRGISAAAASKGSPG